MSSENVELEPAEGLEETPQESAEAGAEVEALQAQVAHLERQVAESDAERAGRRHVGRRWLVGLLIVLGCILLAGGNMTAWVRNVVLETDVWVATVGPLSRNEVIGNALSTYVTDQVFSLVDAQQLAQEALPESLQVLAGLLVGMLRDLVRDTVATLIASDQFNAIWVAVNRTVHQAAMAALRSEGGLVYLQEGQLTIDLTDALDFIQGSLDLEALGLSLEEDAGKFVLLQSQQVAAVQQVLGVIDSLGVWLPLIAVAVLVVAWLVSLWRRQTVLWIGIGVAISMGLSLIVIAVVQPIVLASILDPLVRTLAGEIWGIVVRGLIIQTIGLLVVGILFALGAWLAGPSPRAVSFRTGVQGWFGD